MPTPHVLLRRKIREAFKDVEFPHHCGINAAVLIDDWIADKTILANATKEKDCIGP